jgi:hypothetical protein
MTADAANLLAEIRRSGGDVTLVDCDRLKLVAPTALLPEFAEKVRAAKPMLLAVLADTCRIASAAREGGGGVLNPRRNSATPQRSTAASLSDRAIPTLAAGWLARHREALAHWGALHPAEEAAGQAWGELLSRWHMPRRAGATLAVRRLPRTDRRARGARPRRRQSCAPERAQLPIALR